MAYRRGSDHLRKLSTRAKLTRFEFAKGVFMLRFLTVAFCLIFTIPVQAQAIIDCSSWQASARNIPEPWADNTRTFANGNIRVALLDTIEPAAGAFYLMVITPPYDELGSRACWIVADQDGGIGFMGLEFRQLGASYDPATGLTLRLPATLFAPSTGGFDPAILAVTINQATGDVIPFFEIP